MRDSLCFSAPPNSSQVSPLYLSINGHLHVYPNDITYHETKTKITYIDFTVYRFLIKQDVYYVHIKGICSHFL